MGLRVSVPVAPFVRVSGNPAGCLGFIMAFGLIIWVVKALLVVWWLILPAAFGFCMYMARRADRRAAELRRASQSQATTPQVR